MIVDVQIKHSAETRVRGRVKTRWYDAVVPVEVTEVSSAEAPLAAWIPLAPHATAPRAQAALRSHGGRLYRPIARDSHVTLADRRGRKVDGFGDAVDAGASAMRGTGGGRPVLTADGLAGMIRATMSRSDVTDRLSDVTGTVLAQDRSVKEVVSDTLTARAAEMQGTASGLICVDGFAYKVTGHPVLEVDARSYDTLRHAWEDDVVDPSLCYPITRFDEAVGRARSLRSRTLDARQVKAMRPEVVDASLLDIDFARWVARTVAARTLREFSTMRTGYRNGPELAFSSRETMVAFCHLRDAVAADGDTDALLTRLSDLDGCVNGGLERHLRLDDHGSARLLDRIRSEMALDPDLSDMPRL